MLDDKILVELDGNNGVKEDDMSDVPEAATLEQQLLPVIIETTLAADGHSIGSAAGVAVEVESSGLARLR